MLPIEEPYAFARRLSEGLEPVRRNPAARPTSDEILLPSAGWKLVVPSSAGIVLQQAAETFQAYLDHAMGVQVALDYRASLADWLDLRSAIIVGTPAELPGCGPGLRTTKAYRIVAAPERIVVCGFDERGAMHGLHNLEARMNLREGPLLPRALDSTRHSLYRTRMTLSGLGWMEWPDAYLSLLARYGFDAIYTSDYANPTGAPPPLLYNFMRRQDPALLRDLVQRAARYGIDVYCPLMYQIKGDERDEIELRKLVRDTVREFPEIRGYVLLIEGFFYEELPQWTWSREKTQQWIAQWMRGVRIAADEFQRLNPAIEVLPWDYNVDYRPEAVDLKRQIVAQYPPTVIPLLNWENGKSFTRDGERGYLKDYSISEVGPSEASAAQIEEARKRGMKVFARADAWASWQFGTFPYLPFPQQWLRRYEVLEAKKIDGTLESWTYGFRPNFVAELRAWLSWTDAPSPSELLAAIARREFGPDAAGHALAGWNHFSNAIALVPDTGPDMGTNNAIGAPIFLEKPESRALTMNHSWAEPGLRGGGMNVSSYWPYAPIRLILEPDFSNGTNRAAQYAQPFTLPVFTKFLRAAADEMEKGLRHYRQAALQAPPFRRRSAFREVLLAEQLQRMLRSAEAVLVFEDLRFWLTSLVGAEGRRAILDRMEAILEEEMPRTKASLEAALRDSRLGYQWEQDYVYTPSSLREKLRQLQNVLEVEIPRQRRLAFEAPPAPTITRGPTRPVSTNPRSTFTFESKGAVKFECRLQMEPFGGCASPQPVPALPEGTYTLYLRARNAAGNVSPETTYTWTIRARATTELPTSPSAAKP